MLKPKECPVCGHEARPAAIRPQRGGLAPKYCSVACRDTAAKRRTLAWQKSPRGQYINQRDNAKRRHVSWELSYEEWLALWGDQISLRGRPKDCLCMSRIGDTGPYAAGNVFIQTMSENHSERNKIRYAKG